MSTTPAGWYPDTQTPGQQRYWDGSQWTEHTAPGAGLAQPGQVAIAVANPYDKHYDINQLSEEQRQAYMQHTLTEFPTWAVVVLTIITFGIFGTIYHGLKHSKLPMIKSDDFGAGKGIGFLLIPFFNLYWVFIFWLRLVDRINFQYRLRGAPPPVSRDLALWTIILAISSLIIGITGIASSIMGLIVAAQIQTAANRLVKGEVQPVPGLAAAGIPQAGYAQPAAAQPAPAQPQQPAQGLREPPPPGPPPA
jgi:hypothetical protein